MSVVLLGPRAHPSLAAGLRVEGQPVTLPGRLTGGARAGIDRDAWPALMPGEGSVSGLRVTPGPELSRYAAVMGLKPQAVLAETVLGIGGPPGASWDATAWDAALACEIARQILDAPAAHEHDAVLLQVMTFTRKIGRHFVTCCQTHTCDLTQRRVWLLRRLGLHDQTYATTLRTSLQRR